MFVEKIHFTAQRSIVSIKSIHKMHKATLLSIIGLLAFSCSVKVKQLFSLKVSDNTFYDDDGNNTLSFLQHQQMEMHCQHGWDLT
jgi:hypothetical protein